MAAFALSLGVVVFFAILSLAASVVNGGLGYGYSSLSTPLAILVFVNRIINPAYVLLEAGINTFMLFLSGRKNIAATYRRTIPVILALVPGVIVGSLILNEVAPVWIRFAVYVVILPLILLQAAGFRRPLRGEARAGVPLELGVGLLYSITTISGPPHCLVLEQPRAKAGGVQGGGSPDTYCRVLSDEHILLSTWTVHGAKSLALHCHIASSSHRHTSRDVHRKQGRRGDFQEGLHGLRRRHSRVWPFSNPADAVRDQPSSGRPPLCRGSRPRRRPALPFLQRKIKERSRGD